jgi:hypothetical protein
MYPFYHHHEAIGWIGHLIVASVIHGIVYAMIFRVIQHLSLGALFLGGGLVLGAVALITCLGRYSSRRRDEDEVV